MTYTVHINFGDGRKPYEKLGLPLADAQSLKDHFLAHVPPTVSGSVAPEEKR